MNDCTSGGSIENLLHISELSSCHTMDEYCEKLRSGGATYYDRVEDCPEAHEIGLVHSIFYAA